MQGEFASTALHGRLAVLVFLSPELRLLLFIICSLFLASSFSLSPCFIVFVGFPMCLKLRLCDCVFGITFCYEWSEGSIKDSLFDYGIFHGGPLVLTCMSPELKCLDRVHWGPSLRLALKLPPPHSHRR